MTELEAAEYADWWRNRAKHEHAGDQSSLALERGCRDLCRKLGLNVRVTYDSANDGFFFDCGLRSTPRAGVLIDQEMFYGAPRVALADMVTYELTAARDKVFENARSTMTTHDGRIASLTHTDRHALHELLMDLENFVLDGGPFREEPRRARVATYRELLLRILK